MSIKDQTQQECERVGYLIFGIIAVIFLGVMISRFKVSLKDYGYFTPPTDPILGAKVQEVFPLFQKAWSEFDTVTLQKITTTKFYNLLVLQLGVLKNEGRVNQMTDVKLIYEIVDPKKYSSMMALTTFTATVRGKAHDVLYDNDLQKELYSDNSAFTEFWTFVLENNEWKLDKIDQSTADLSMVRQKVQDFAVKNNFFYNPDFGWLMIPNKGVLFSQSSFKTTDVNDHVIGVYKNKIVEFYTISFKRDQPRFFIGQAILPKAYSRILVQRKNKFTLITPSYPNMRKLELESIAFNDEFNVFSDNADTMTTFELLHPAFMEYIMKLPYKVSIEVVGNTLYFYTQSKEIDYDKLLEILSRAFDEIKE